MGIYIKNIKKPWRCDECMFTDSLDECIFLRTDADIDGLNIGCPIVEIADRKTENSSEKPNNCEHITEGGVTCAKYPACDDCLDNPLNKVKGSERLLKGKDEPQMGDAKPIPLSNRVTHIKDEPQTEVVMPKKCKGCDSASKIIEAYSRGFEDGAEAVKAVAIKALHEDYIEPYVTIEDEPQNERSE